MSVLQSLRRACQQSGSGSTPAKIFQRLTGSLCDFGGRIRLRVREAGGKAAKLAYGLDVSNHWILALGEAFLAPF
jgi:hypothetical protein